MITINEYQKLTKKCIHYYQSFSNTNYCNDEIINK